MGDQNTDAMNGKRPFEERVFARFDALDLSMRVMDSSMRDMDARLQKLEVRTYDTKPIWEQAPSLAVGPQTLFDNLNANLGGSKTSFIMLFS